MNPIVSLLFSILSVACAGGAFAQDQPPPEIADQVAQCVTCHGEDGRPTIEEAPIIAGQQFYYLLVQLRDFAAARRDSEIMTPIAKEMDKAQMEALAKYFSGQSWPSIQAQATDEQRSIGQRLGTAGQCTQCHLGGYKGDSRNPQLGGQTAAYLEKTMLDFKNHRRKNAPDMSALLDGFSDEDLAAMAHYLAAL